MLAHEPGHAAPVPERAASEEAAVGGRLMVVDHDRFGDVPALPAGLARSVGEVDVFAVEVIALVEAAEFVERLATQEEEGAEEPVGRRGLGGTLVEQVVPTLAALGMEEAAQRRPAHERSADRWEAAPRGLPAPVGIAELRSGDAAARPPVGEFAEGIDRAGRDHDVRVRGNDVLGAGCRDAPVDVRAEAEGALVRDHSRPCSRRGAAGVRNEHEFFHLRCERLEASARIGISWSEDDDRGDAQSRLL
jgi:hypothetical protein